jgi:putative ABC transport system permease protein
VINDDAARTHSGMLLLGSLAVLALVLALGGIYGIVSYSAQRRYHEIGIRLALGAQPRDVLARIVGSALVQSAIGVGAGIVIAGLTTNRLGDNLSVISPLDAPTFVAVACLFIACSAIAAFVPAVRAARSDPALTLRYE